MPNASTHRRKRRHKTGGGSNFVRKKRKGLLKKTTERYNENQDDLDCSGSQEEQLYVGFNRSR